MLLLLGGVVYGVRHSAEAQPDFWRSFIPGLWANIIGVSIGAIVGVPVGFGINHYVVRITERRHHERQVSEVRQLLEQVKNELNLHLALLPRLTSIFSVVAQSPTTAVQAGQQPSILGESISSLMLQDTFGKQFMGNRSVLDAGETLVLFQVSSYYTRVWDLNRLLAFRIQDARPETRDRKIGETAYTVSTARIQVEYEIQQTLTRLSANG